MRKIYKPLILLTAIMSLSFSAQAAEPAKKEAIQINNIIGAYSLNTKEATLIEPETAAAALSTLNVSKGLYLYDESGNIYYQDSDGQAYTDGLAPDNYVYDKNGVQVNSLYSIRDKYLEQFNSSSASDIIVFDNLTERDLFISWYQLEMGIVQGKTIHWYHETDDKSGIQKQEFLKIPSTKKPEYEEKVTNIVNQLTECESKSEKILKATELVANTFTYDTNYMKLDMNKAVREGRGVCYHYAKLLHDVFNSAGIKNELMLGYAGANNQTHIWNRAFDEETNSWIYADATSMNADAVAANFRMSIPSAYLGYYFQATLS